MLMSMSRFQLEEKIVKISKEYPRAVIVGFIRRNYGKEKFSKMHHAELVNFIERVSGGELKEYKDTKENL